MRFKRIIAIFVLLYAVSLTGVINCVFIYLFLQGWTLKVIQFCTLVWCLYDDKLTCIGFGNREYAVSFRAYSIYVILACYYIMVCALCIHHISVLHVW